MHLERILGVLNFLFCDSIQNGTGLTNLTHNNVQCLRIGEYNFSNDAIYY